MKAQRLSGWIRRNLLGLIAIFIALGGTAVAATVARNSVTSKSIKKGAVKSVDVQDEGLTAIDIDETTLEGIQGPPGEAGPKGDPGPQGPPGPSTGPAGGDLRGSYPNPTLRAPEVTLAGLPDAGDGIRCAPGDAWQDLATIENEVGYYRDPLGRVFLQGIATKCGNPASGNRIFTLPPGFRPSPRREIHPTLAGGGSFGEFGVVIVAPDGSVEAVAGNFDADTFGFMGLNGLSFRCAPSGANGCP